MKCPRLVYVLLVLVFLLTACNIKSAEQEKASLAAKAPAAPAYDGATQIVLSDSGITVDGAAVSTDTASAVYAANDIVYYEIGKDITYGEGSVKDAHSSAEAAAHTVVHITKSGAYSLSGKISYGQIAVDLGDDAKKDPDAVVTLVLNGIDITCEVAPAIIFYNVYECGTDDIGKASKDVDTSAAGANVIIADGTVNTVNGSYVEKIYKPDSVVLSDDKTEVVSADKLHKYDGAFYSKRSMNIFGGKENTGILNIKAQNEGLDSEMHLTINGGDIRIESGNDGINTNEDGISVTSINGGKLTIKVTGETGEGDGIDSNGWLVINGGTVVAEACSNSADAGIDSDMGIHINGGTVIATGHMLDRIEDGGQNYAVFNFAQKQTGKEPVAMKAQNGKIILEAKPENAFSILIFSSPDLKAGTYTLWSGGKQLAGSSGGMMWGPGMEMGGIDHPARPDNRQPPADGGQPSKDFAPPEGGIPPKDRIPPQGGNLPEGSTLPGNNNRPEMPGGNNMASPAMTTDFIVRDGGNMFSGILQNGER